MEDINEKSIDMTPPWYTLSRKIKYTYGMSTLVQVNDLLEVCNQYIQTITVSNDAVAHALRQLLPLSVQMGNIVFVIVIFNAEGNIVQVTNESYTPETLNVLITTALTDNPLFVNAILTNGLIDEPLISLVGDVVAVIEKEVVQFYNDDISELCSNFNDVASKVFKEITLPTFEGGVKLGFSTYDPNCSIQNN